MEKKLLIFTIIFELLYYVNAQFYLIPIPLSPSTSYNLITNYNYNQYSPSPPYETGNAGLEEIENEDLSNSTQKEIWLDDAGYEQNLLDGLDTSNILSDEVSSDAPKDCAKCDCGLRYRFRIVGGKIADKYEFPWIAVVQYKKMFICGGSLINDRYVVTAGHCTEGLDHKLFQVKFHEHDRYLPKDTEVIIKKVNKIIEHRNYDGSNLSNDIALLKMSEPMTFTGTLPRPICLPEISDNLAGKTAVAAGWGATSSGGSTSAKLKKVFLPIITNDVCKQKYGSAITRGHLCAGKKSGGEDTCQGDSGGPLMYLKDKKFELIGITSYGEGCAQKNTPGVYTRVTSQLKWIESNTKDACKCK